MNTRRTRLKLLYQGRDISKDIADDFISFDYTDNEDGKADDIILTLQDKHGLWTGAWFPSKSDTIKATIIDEGFGELYCGAYQIDDLVSAGPPRTFQIKGVSIPLNTAIRRESKDKAWEEVLLSEIVQEIGASAGVQVIYDVTKDPKYDRIDQRAESDLAFLKRICESEGLSLKLTDARLVVFSQEKYEDAEPIVTLAYGKSNIVSWNFESQAFDLYKSATVSYYDATTETNIEMTFDAPNIADGMVFKVTKRASSPEEAERMARANLRRLNKHEVKASFDLVGDVNLISGTTCLVDGFGKFSGKYMIEKANHSVSDGYKVKLDLRKVLEGY